MHTLKSKAKDVEQARKKVTQDVEKLIRNQETFEKRVTEMDSVYQMLTTEQQKLKQKKAHFATLVNDSRPLQTLQSELANLRQAYK